MAHYISLSRLVIAIIEDSSPVNVLQQSNCKMVGDVVPDTTSYVTSNACSRLVFIEVNRDIPCSVIDKSWAVTDVCFSSVIRLVDRLFIAIEDTRH